MSASLYMRSGDMRESMPQTVPSASLSPSCDAFDLSLLPASSDCEVPYSPTNVHQLMSLFCDATSSPPPMFPSSYHDVDLKGKAEPVVPGIKTEPGTYLGSCTSWENHSTFLSPTYIKQEATTLDLSEILLGQRTDDLVPQVPTPTRRPSTDDYLGDASVPQMEDDAMKRVSDHQLLREVLKDTSFQRKFNLKPFDLGGLAALQGTTGPGSWPLRRTLSGGANGSVKMDEDLPQLDQEAIEPMISLAIQQMRKDISNTCSVLGISPDPALWTPDDVHAWLLWTLRQFSLPPVQLSLFDMDGAALAALSEMELLHLAPQAGSLLFAQLEIWRASCAENTEADVDTLMESWGDAPAVPTLVATVPQIEAHNAAPVAATELVGQQVGSLQVGSPQSQHSGHHSSASSADTSDDEDEESEPASGAGTSGGGRGAHIHLWQFLKELLGSPQGQGACVRWLDRPAGVFKIEDSVRVARLWGARKNRPAMNYDKLSRSIRQYYKKGIMKKTERSQRLVYQFCHPYSL